MCLHNYTNTNIWFCGRKKTVNVLLIDASVLDDGSWRDGEPSTGYGEHPELVWGMGKAQHTLQAGDFSRNRREGEALEERRKEQKQLHSGQGLP